LQNYGLRVNFKENEGPLYKILKITDFRIYSGIENSWTGSTGHGPAAHPGPWWTGAGRAQRPRCRMASAQRAGRRGSPAGWVREGRARPGDGSPRQNLRRRGDAMGSETATAAASERWRSKRLGGEESEGEGVGNDGERRGPFIVAGEGHTGARKGETACGKWP
jgi:hypothetical protein